MAKTTTVPEQPFHYFCSSMATWVTDTDVNKALRTMKREDTRGYHIMKGCNVFYVPLPKSANYDINYYQPQVEGVKFLGYYDYKKGWDFSHYQNENTKVEFSVNFVMSILQEQGTLAMRIDERLDDWVHDLHSEAATKVNNGGRTAQLEYLIGVEDFSSQEVLNELVPNWEKKEKAS